MSIELPKEAAVVIRIDLSEDKDKLDKCIDRAKTMALSSISKMINIGLYYTEDPTYQKRNYPFIYNKFGTYQVLVPEDNLFRVIAECIYEADAEQVLKSYLK